MAEIQTLVVIVRDPDASNNIHTWGPEVKVYDIDAGYMDLDDNEEYAEWRDSHNKAADELEAQWPEAADYIRQTVVDYEPDGFVDPNADEDEEEEA